MKLVKINKKHVPNHPKINTEPNHTKDIKKQFKLNKAFNISQKSVESNLF